MVVPAIRLLPHGVGGGVAEGARKGGCRKLSELGLVGLGDGMLSELGFFGLEDRL